MATSFTAQELFNLPEPSPSNWIVEGILRSNRGRPSLLCGFPESGKSTLSNQLAVAVANGTPFLDRATQQGHVILWKNEDSAPDIAADLRRAGLTASSDLSIVLPEPDKANIIRLKDELTKFPDTSLVIVETFQEFFEGVKDITKNDDCKNALQEFTRELVAPHPDCAFLILHQFSKSNDNADLSIKKILGGTALAAGTDAKIYLRRVGDADPRRIIHATVRKGKPILPSYLIWDDQTLTVRLGENVNDEESRLRREAKNDKAIELENRVCRIVCENPGLTKAKLMEQVGGRAAITKAKIDALIEIGVIIVKPGGEKGNAQLIYPMETDGDYLLSKMNGGNNANID